VSIPYVVDGETEIDSALFNPWIDLINESIAAYDLPETVDNALAGVFNILDYGADPTGVTNSTTAIQAAATAARASTLPHSSTNGRVYAPQGTYLYSDEIDMRDVPFTGQGWGTTFKATHADAVFLLGSSYETTGHFRIDGNDLAEYGAHFYPMAGGYYPHIYVQDCTIYGVTFNGTQNSIIDLMSISNCGRANLVLRNGCGSLIFNHFESTYADRGLQRVVQHLLCTGYLRVRRWRRGRDRNRRKRHNAGGLHRNLDRQRVGECLGHYGPRWRG
jgi:hypothetical protein